MTSTEFRRGGPSVKAAWNELEHPRDSRGRFIETGANVQLSGGLRGKVIEIRPDPQRNITAVKIQLTDGRTGWERNDRLIVLDPDKNELPAGKGKPTPKAPAKKPDVTRGDPKNAPPQIKNKLSGSKTAEEWRNNLKAQRTTGTPKERLKKSFPHLFDEQVHWGDASEDEKHAIINGMEDAAAVAPILKERNMIGGIDLRDNIPGGSKNTMGGMDMSSFRKFYLNNAALPRLDATKDRVTASGVWANYGDAESGLYAVTVHEMGHAVHAALSGQYANAYAQDALAREILENASADGKHLRYKVPKPERTLAKSYVAKHLSEYGASNDYETIAESFAESVVQGPGARPLARDVTNSMVGRLDGRETKIPEMTPEAKKTADKRYEDIAANKNAVNLAVRAADGDITTKYVPTMSDDDLRRELNAANRAVDFDYSSSLSKARVVAYRNAVQDEYDSRNISEAPKPTPEPTPAPEAKPTPKPTPTAPEATPSGERPNNTGGFKVGDTISVNGFEGEVISVRPNRKDASVPPVLIYKDADGTKRSAKANKVTRTGEAGKPEKKPESAPNPVAPEKPAPPGDIDRQKTPFVVGDRVSANGREGTITSVRGGGPDDKRSLVIFKEDDGTYRTARFGKATRVDKTPDKNDNAPDPAPAPEAVPDSAPDTTPDATPDPTPESAPDDLPEADPDEPNDPDSDPAYEPLVKARQELEAARNAARSNKGGETKRKYVENSEKISEAKRKVAEEERRSKLSERDRLAEDVDKSDKNIELLRNNPDVPPNIMAEIERKHREQKDRLAEMDRPASSEDAGTSGEADSLEKQIADLGAEVQRRAAEYDDLRRKGEVTPEITKKYNADRTEMLDRLDDLSDRMIEEREQANEPEMDGIEDSGDSPRPEGPYTPESLSSPATDEEVKQAVLSYRGQSYAKINGTLRKGLTDKTKFNKPGIDERLSDDDHRARVDKLIGALDQGMEPSKANRELYRNVSNPEFIENLNPGDRFTDHGYTSTTASQDTLDFDEFGDYTLKINAPKGTPMQDFRERPGGPENEQELLLARGTEFEVVEKNENGMTLRVVRNGVSPTDSKASGMGDTETRKATNWEQS